MLQSLAPVNVVRTHGLIVEVRQPDELDAEGMKNLFAERAAESAPSCPERGAWRAEWCDENDQGHAKFLTIIRNAEEQPQTYCARVARIGDSIVGMVYGHALPDSHVTLCHHIAVKRRLEGRGIGTALLDSFEYGWAMEIGRPILSHIDPANTKSQRLFQRNGYQHLGKLTTLYSTEINGSRIGLPMTFDVRGLLLGTIRENTPKLIDLLYDDSGLMRVAKEFAAQRTDPTLRVDEDLAEVLIERLGLSILPELATSSIDILYDGLGKDICNSTQSERLLCKPGA